MVKKRRLKSGEIAWFLPRLHHNYIEWINLLSDDCNIASTIYVVTSSQQLQRPSSARIVQLIESRFSTFLGARYGYGGANKFRFIANLRSLWGIFKVRKFSKVVIREPSRILSLQVLIFCLLFRVEHIVLYSQTHKIYQKRVFNRTVNALFGFLNLTYVSTVMPPLDCFNYPNMRFIPFIHSGEESVCDYTNLRILTISKFQERKRLIEFLDIVREMVMARVMVKWLVIGEINNFDQQSYYEKLKELVLEYRLESHVEIKVNLGFEEVRSSYKWCNLFLLASCNEPAAYSVIEALSFARPTFCDVSNGTHGYIHQPRYGYTFSGLKGLNETIKLAWESGTLDEMHNNILADNRSAVLYTRHSHMVTNLLGSES